MKYTSKQHLQQRNEDGWIALWDLLKPLSKADMERKPKVRTGSMIKASTGWTPKDILAHILEWQLMFLGWYKAGEAGKEFELPAPGYKWSQIPALNDEIYAKYKNMELKDIKRKLRASHKKISAIIESIPEQRLLKPKQFSWTGTSTFATYVGGSLGAHYEWAYKTIKRNLK